MLKQYALNGFERKQIIATTLFFDNTRVFIDNEDYFTESDYLGWCPGIFKHNVSSNKIDRYSFERGVRIISHECAKATIYYAYMEGLSRGVSVNFRRLNCVDFTDTEILSLIFEKDKKVNLDNLPFHIRLYGVSERYGIASLSQTNYKRGDTYHSKLLLLDAEENKYYNIPDKLGKSDSLLRVNSILVREHDNKTYILIKTGLIESHEKENSYKKQIIKATQAEHFNSLETLVCVDSENFIKCIKEGLDIPEHFIVDTCDYKCSFAYYTLTEGTVNYQKHDFPSQTSEIVEYNLESGKISTRKFKGCNELIVLLDSGEYCIKYTNQGQSICDIDKNKIIFRTANEGILYFNSKDNYVITNQPQNDLNSKVFLHNLDDNKSENIGQGWAIFDSQHQILTIFSNN